MKHLHCLHVHLGGAPLPYNALHLWTCHGGRVLHTVCIAPVGCPAPGAIISRPTEPRWSLNQTLSQQGPYMGAEGGREEGGGR
jgi:hypothetical protein